MKHLPKPLRFALVVILTIVILGLLSTALRAQDALCGDAAMIDLALAEKYGEARLFTGTGSRGETVALWGNPDTGTWTLVMYITETYACLMKSGGGLVVARIKPNA